MKMMNDLLQHISTNPVFGLALTLAAYKVAVDIQKRFRGSAFANPVAMAVSIVLAVLWLSNTSYESYFASAKLIHILLGPATVAMAYPIYKYSSKLRKNWFSLSVMAVFGSLTAVATTFVVARLVATPNDIALSLSPKSVTTPIAMGIAEKIGGIPSLTAAVVIATGIFGAVFAGKIFDLVGIVSPDIRGFAMGISAHGIGTARAFQESAETGAHSGLAMGLNGILTAIFLPSLLHLSGFLQ